MLIHRCDACGHPEEWHNKRDCSYGYCPCTPAKQVINPVPELVRRFVTGSTTVVTDICPPGVPPFGAHFHARSTATCACDACQSAYADLTAKAAG